jgi:hypothetical protein
MTDYKATPEQWVNLERRQLGGNDLVCAALELRARVEALEANHPEKPDSSACADSLVERVSCAIDGRINPDQWLHQDAARAALREVAAWLKKSNGVLWTMDQTLFNLGETTYEDLASEAISVIAELLELEAEP